MGTARLWIISWPTLRNVCAGRWSMLRLSENQVPQSTPITRAKSTLVAT